MPAFVVEFESDRSTAAHRRKTIIMEHGPGGVERRRIPRIWVNFDVALISGKKKIHCHARQLSEVGILVATSHREIVGETVDLEMSINGGQMTTSGMVVYATPNGVGIRFKDLNAEQRQTLKVFLDAHGIAVTKR